MRKETPGAVCVEGSLLGNGTRNPLWLAYPYPDRS
jgi:hypothetical protein